MTSSAAASPLLAHAAPTAVVAYRRGEPIAARQFLADAVQLADRLPPSAHVLNVCSDRYRFAVGLAACLITDRISLLPSTHTPEVIRRLAAFAPDVLCLTDAADCTIDLPRLQFPESQSTAIAWQVPLIAAQQLAAIVFTSGSTGTPVPYKKTWGKLTRGVREGARLLGLEDGAAHTLIGTVPTQHMYGFESTVLLALVTGNAFSADRPFYPADICAAIAAVPRPRALISTPVHLRALLAAGVMPPPVDLIVSATAPLAAELARAAEALLQARLLEIYGSTETGQIACRRTASSAIFRLWPDVRLTARDGRVFAEGGHVEQVTPLCDVVELIGDDEFLLQGRTLDLVNVAGRRSSIAHLNSQLQAIPGVVDGVFFLCEKPSSGQPGRGVADTGIVRLAAAVVAPTLSAAQLTQALRQRIDPVFLPRPLLLVDRLPRNATGKLPHEALQSLAARAPRSRAAEAPHATFRSHLKIAVDHASYAGHFPGSPILPGAVLLDEALYEIERSRRIDLTEWRIAAAKFLEAVRPGDALTLEHSAPDARTIRFVIRSAEGAVASGMLSAAAPADGDPGA